MQVLMRLFLSFCQVGMFSIGGGYVAIPLIQEQAVNINGWLTMGQFSDLLTISEMTPGPITLNAATFVGNQIAGFPGALAATFGAILPSCVVASALAYLYYKYRTLSVMQNILAFLRPAIVALIASAGVSLISNALWGASAPGSITAIDPLKLALFAGALGVLRKLRPNPVFVMLGCGAVTGILHFIL